MVTSGGGTGTRRWIVLGVLCLATTSVGVDSTILSVALPSIVRDMHVSGAEVQWLVDAYMIVFAGLLLTAGALGDRLGRRACLLVGLAGYVVFSAVAGRAQTPHQIIFARGLIGLAAACVWPTTLSILTNVFHEPAERTRAIALWAGVSSVGLVLGPPLGGLVILHFDWHAVFWVNVPLCSLTFLLAARYVPPTPRSPHKLDPLGALLSIVGLVLVLWAIIAAPDRGWSDPAVVGGLAGGLLVLVAFWQWELRCDSPMLPVVFFRNRRFTAASATVTITTFGMVASMFVIAQYFQFILGYSPLKAGFLMVPVAAGIMSMAPRSPGLVRRFGSAKVVVCGLLVLLAAMSWFLSDTVMSNIVGAVVVRFLYGAATGIIMPPVTEAIMGSLPRERAGVGSAVNDTTRQLGGALGVALLGSVFSAQFHGLMDRATQLPDDVRSVARESIGATTRLAAETKDEAAAAALRAAGRHAFLLAMRPMFLLAMAVTAGAAVVAGRFLPSAPIDGAPAEDEVDEALLAGVETAVVP